MSNATVRGLAAVAEAALSTTSAAALTVAAAAPAAAAATPAAPAAAPDNTAALAAERASTKAEGVKEGTAAERARIKAIVTSDQAKGRETLAQSLAFNTDLSAEQAVAVLGDAPKQSRLDGNVPNPKVDAVETTEGDRKPLVSGLAAATKAEFERRNPGARK